MPGIELNRVTKSYGAFDAVRDFSLTLTPGEAVGLVGESGCGKSTVAALLLRLTRPDSGRLLFDGREVSAMSKRELRDYRRQVQIVFQDTASALNPRMTAFQSIAEPMRNFLRLSPGELRREAVRLIEAVGMEERDLARYPRAFSGGQRQRVAIARAISIRPRFLVLDEVTASLDVSIQAHILNLLLDLRGEYGLACLFISHDLGVVRYVSDRIVVMYRGRQVEAISGQELTGRACHPYTRLLLDSVPVIGKRTGRPEDGARMLEPGPGTGCGFYDRCLCRREDCLRRTPELTPVDGGHFAACFHRLEMEDKPL